MKNYLCVFMTALLAIGILTGISRSLADDRNGTSQMPDPFVNLNKEFGHDWTEMYGKDETNEEQDVHLKEAMSSVIFQKLFLLLKPKLIPKRSFIATNVKLFDDVRPQLQKDIISPNGESFITLPVDTAVLPFTYSEIPLLLCMNWNFLYVTMPEKHDMQHLDIETAKKFANKMAEKLFVVDMEEHEYEFVPNGNQATLKIKSNSDDYMARSKVIINFSPSFISFRFNPFLGMRNLGRTGQWFESSVAHFNNINSSRFVSQWNAKNDNQYKLLFEEVKEHYTTSIEFTKPHTASEKEEWAKVEQLQLSLKCVLDPKMIVDEDDFLSYVQVKSILEDKQLQYLAIYKLTMGKLKQLPVVFSNYENKVRMAVMLGQGYGYDAKKGYAFTDDESVKSAFMWILNNYFRWVPNPEDVSIERQENDDKIYIRVAGQKNQPYRIKEAVFFKHGQYIVLDDINLQ